MLVHFFDNNGGQKRYGAVVYVKQDNRVMVTHPSSKVRSDVRKYFTTSRSFAVVEEPRDELSTAVHSEQVATATDSEELFTQALSEMFYRTGYTVDWSNKDNRIVSKATAKSITSDDEYDIIN